jgi:hypothetical protein
MTPSHTHDKPPGDVRIPPINAFPKDHDGRQQNPRAMPIEATVTWQRSRTTVQRGGASLPRSSIAWWPRSASPRRNCGCAGPQHNAVVMDQPGLPAAVFSTYARKPRSPARRAPRHPTTSATHLSQSVPRFSADSACASDSAMAASSSRTIFFTVTIRTCATSTQQ